MSNLTLPGNPRYQPSDLIPYFGYDNLMRWLAEVEVANLQVLGEIGVMAPEVFELLNEEMIASLYAITTTEVDEREKITKHDIRAWVELAKERLPPELAQWVHVPLTSYDALDTARTLLFTRAYHEVVRPKLIQLIHDLASSVELHADTLQGGRTHGQPALPITVGFWLATVLNRLIYCLNRLDVAVEELVGKISGAVGASNAIAGLGFAEKCGEYPYEVRVLHKIGLQPGPISTQILPPEPMADFLHAVVMTSAALGQFGRDGRHLMRLEIAEIAEPFTKGQTGSSTMAHKRNPISFEGLEGQWLKTKSEYGKVLDTLISEHQRDLVGSTVMRDFPIMVVNLVTQINTLVRSDSSGKSFLSRLRIDEEACRRNFDRTGHLILAEPLYIALQMAGYEADAHDTVNHRITPVAAESGRQLIDVAEELALSEPILARALSGIPKELKDLLHQPDQYVGNAGFKAREISRIAFSLK